MPSKFLTSAEPDKEYKQLIMETVQKSIRVPINNNNNGIKTTDNLNNEVSSTSSEDGVLHSQIKITKIYKKNYTETPASDNEVDAPRRPGRIQSRNHYKSMGNINENSHRSDMNCNVNRLSNIDLSLHQDEIKRFENLQIPIVGYEVMEERARFTIYKLKVEDDKRDQSWLVFRRYTDFVRLYSRIKSERPDIILPLPNKRWFRDNFEPTFLEERVRGLQIFVNAVISKLPKLACVREFFCLDEPPQVFSYQPEVQAVYGALEDTISTLRMQLKQKDATISHLQKRLALYESQAKSCSNCSTHIAMNSM